MATPYTSVTVTDYNANPPSDDASQVASNQLNWSKHKTKLGDPLKTAIESINTNVAAASRPPMAPARDVDRVAAAWLVVLVVMVFPLLGLSGQGIRGQRA